MMDNNKSLGIQRSLVTACYITIMQYYPKRNESPQARAYVKQSIEAIRFVQKFDFVSKQSSTKQDGIKECCEGSCKNNSFLGWTF